jgi:hypothetical protein
VTSYHGAAHRILTGHCGTSDNFTVSSLSVLAAQFLQTDACPPTDPSCVRPTAATREPIFEGFGVHEFLVIGSAALATLVGLVVIAWLLVRLTGAHRDYLPLAPRPAGAYEAAHGGAPLGSTPPRRPRIDISPSTWVGVGCVFVLAIVVASWIALRDDDETSTSSSTSRTTSSSTTVAPATSVSTLPASCTKPALTASFLPAGFDPQLAAGFGVTLPSDPGCAFHWKGATGVISVLLTGDSPLGPPGNVQERIVRNGRTVWAGAAPGGGIGVIIEEKELGGAPDIWFTLLSTTVPRADLVETALNLQRG